MLFKEGTHDGGIAKRNRIYVLRCNGVGGRPPPRALQNLIFHRRPSARRPNRMTGLTMASPNRMIRQLWVEAPPKGPWQKLNAGRESWCSYASNTHNRPIVWFQTYGSLFTFTWDRYGSNGLTWLTEERHVMLVYATRSAEESYVTLISRPSRCLGV